ncbi:MAG: HAD family hydrolase [Kiloniellales bacterium]
MTLSRPKALLFDWDNTLVDSWALLHRSMNVTLAGMGEPAWSYEETRRRVRASARESFPHLFGERAEEAAALFYRTFEASHLEALCEVPGAGGMIAELAGAGFYLAVVSNKMGPILRREAAHLGWDRHFRALVGANDAARDKPAAEVVDLALAGSGLAPGPEVWLIGDTDIDMACAVNAGCVPVLLRPEAPVEGEFATAAPHLHLKNCAALAQRLREV